MSALRSSQARTNRHPTIQSRKTISIKQWYKLSQNLWCLSFVAFQELQPHHRGGKGSTTPTWNSSLIMRCDEAFKQWQQVLKWYLSNPFLTQNIIVTLCSVFKLDQIELERSATWICPLGCTKISKSFRNSILTWYMLYLYERRFLWSSSTR